MNHKIIASILLSSLFLISFIVGAQDSDLDPVTPVPVIESNPCEHSRTALNCVEFLKNYDGDTLTVNVPGVHPLFGEKISVRVFGIDAPEKTGRKPCEKARARAAQRLIENVLKQAKRIDLRNVQRDKYFRILADVWADESSVADILIKNGLAYLYDGGHKPELVNWCRTPAKARDEK